MLRNIDGLLLTRKELLRYSVFGGDHGEYSIIRQRSRGRSYRWRRMWDWAGDDYTVMEPAFQVSIHQRIVQDKDDSGRGNKG